MTLRVGCRNSGGEVEFGDGFKTPVLRPFELLKDGDSNSEKEPDRAEYNCIPNPLQHNIRSRATEMHVIRQPQTIDFKQFLCREGAP